MTFDLLNVFIQPSDAKDLVRTELLRPDIVRGPKSPASSNSRHSFNLSRVDNGDDVDVDVDVDEGWGIDGEEFSPTPLWRIPGIFPVTKKS